MAYTLAKQSFSPAFGGHSGQALILVTLSSHAYATGGINIDLDSLALPFRLGFGEEVQGVIALQSSTGHVLVGAKANTTGNPQRINVKFYAADGAADGTAATQVTNATSLSGTFLLVLTLGRPAAQTI